MAQALRPYCQAYKRLPVRVVMNETKINFNLSLLDSFVKAYLSLSDFWPWLLIRKSAKMNLEYTHFLDRQSQDLFPIKDGKYG